MNFVSNTIYALKKQFGVTVRIYFPDTNTTNYQTGVLTRTYKQKDIKAILLPKRRSMMMFHRLMSQGFKHGGQLDIDSKTILIDRADLTENLTTKHHIEFNSQRYEIKEVMVSEDNKAYILTLTGTSGAPLIDSTLVQNSVTFTQVASGIIE